MSEFVWLRGAVPLAQILQIAPKRARYSASGTAGIWSQCVRGRQRRREDYWANPFGMPARSRHYPAEGWLGYD